MKPIVLGSLLVFALAAAVRLPDLGASCNVDAILYWFERTRHFWRALGEGRFSDTYLSPHPGVSVMWLSGLSMQFAGTLFRAVSERSLAAATLPIALLGSLIPALTLPLLERALGTEATRGKLLGVPVIAAALLATEPFLVAHSRTFQLDALVTGFVWLGVLLSALTLLERRVAWAIAGGGCLGAAVLTRALSGAFALSLVLAFIAAFVVEKPRTKRTPLLLLVLGGTALAVVVLLWPAMWMDPVGTVVRVLRASSRIVDRGHPELSWGRIYEDDPGIGFYAGVFLMRLSPEVLLGCLLGLFMLKGASRRTLLLLGLVAAAYLPPGVGLLLGAKKADRYALLFFPPLALLAAASAVELARRVGLAERFRKRSVVIGSALAGLVLLGRVARLVHAHPLPITWCASYPGLRCENVITLGQGEGFREAALWIRDHSPVAVPAVLSAYSRGAVMSPWLAFTQPKSGNSAHFVVTYISTDQRKRDQYVTRFAVGKPVHEVRFQNRVYARIYLGKRHPDAPRGR